MPGRIRFRSTFIWVYLLWVSYELSPHIVTRRISVEGIIAFTILILRLLPFY